MQKTRVTVTVRREVLKRAERQVKRGRAGSGALDITALDADEARAVGVLCRETGTSDVKRW
jgi:hypothetical protein